MSFFKSLIVVILKLFFSPRINSTFLLLFKYKLASSVIFKLLVLYKVNNYYDPESEISISWKDPILNLPWPMKEEDIILAKKDSDAISFDELDIKF